MEPSNGSHEVQAASLGAQTPMPSAVTCVAQMYSLAGRICQFARLKFVIEVGESFGAALVAHLSGAVYLSILPSDGQAGSSQSGHNLRVVTVDFNQFLQLDDSILAESIILWPCIDRHLSRYPQLAGRMAEWFARAPYVMISHGSTMGSGAAMSRVQAFDAYLAQVGAATYARGTCPYPTAGPFELAVGGRHAVYRPTKRLRVLAIISCYNDADFILNVVRHLIGEGVAMHFIDNWSSDGTWDMLQELSKSMPEHVVAVERYPKDAQDTQYNWYEILARKEDVAFEADYDWFIHYDSDELRTSCWPGVTMVDALGFIDGLGYNVVNHSVVEFRPTKDGFTSDDDAKTFFEHFEFNDIDANSNQLKAWKKQPERVDLVSSGGHLVAFSQQRVYPLCFLLAHYSLRSTAQARRKIYEERLPRVVKESTERLYHGHYRKYTADAWVLSSFLWDQEKLHKFDAQTFPGKYLMQRLAGA